MVSHALITGGAFDRHHNDNRQLHLQVQGTKGFDHLQDAVAPAAFHNSGERFDPPKCHPKTRVAVLKKIMDWILGCDPETQNALIMWLKGPTGAGKSAIAQTIAELCHSEGRLLASFFFNRSDPTRNHVKSLIATIAYQISSTIPAALNHIVVAIENDPSILTRPLFTQLTSLIVEPLRDLISSGNFSDPSTPRLILIDGLDECLDRQAQVNILETILKAIRHLHVPFIFLLESRPEHQISLAFNSTNMTGVHNRLVMDDSYLSDDDIELFLRDQFEEMKANHTLQRFIPSVWPTDEAIRGLVSKSSGQFIYASTVVKYVKFSRQPTAFCLEVILCLRAACPDLPFAELDALYTYIFDLVEDIDLVLHLLRFYVLGSTGATVDSVERILTFDPGDTETLFCDLGSIVALREGSSYSSELSFHILHASLSDFLLDQTRSKEHYIDINLKRTEHIQQCLQFLTYAPFADISTIDAHCSAIDFFSTHCEETLPSAELRVDILNFSLARIYREVSDAAEDVGEYELRKLIRRFNFFFLPKFLRFLERSESHNADDLYIHHLQSFDQVMMHHLEFYYADMRLTLLVLLIDFVINRKCSHTLVFNTHLMPFDLDPTMFGIDQSCLSLICVNNWHGYLRLIHDFLDDPARSGRYAFDGAKYATAALCCLIYLCDHSSAPQKMPSHRTGCDNEMRRNCPWLWLRKSRKSHSSGTVKTSRILCTKQEENIASERVYPRFDMNDPIIAQRVWSHKFAVDLEYLLYFLPRFGKDDKLITFARRRTFASRSQEFPDRSKKARRAIAEYLERMESNEV